MFKVIKWGLMFLYLYTLTFDQFLNLYFRFPTPFLFCFPLLLFWSDIKKTPFLFKKEAFVIFISCFVLYALAQKSVKDFFVNISVLTSCALYFNYFIGSDKIRFKYSVFIFFSLLLLSGIVLILNQYQGTSIDIIRAKLLGRKIDQSPSGISATIFTFGYQVAALSGFLFIFSLKKKLKLIVQLAVLAICLVLIYFGLQRSAAVGFLASVFLFSLFYYRSRAVYIISIMAVIVIAISSQINFQDISSGAADNIFAKNERSIENGEDRKGLITENLKIYSHYPFGLLFYGKSWHDVTAGSFVFRNGLTSHNAYLMFITYLGPFLGIGLLAALYLPLYRIFKRNASRIRVDNNALLVSLCFGLLSVIINAMFHNAWLLSSNGPTVFLYFAVLHAARQESWNI